MQPGHRYCNVTFDGQTFCIPLPDAVPHNFHTFIREELIAAGVHNLSNKALQIEAVGMNIPTLLTPMFAARPGSYRVKEHEQAALQADSDSTGATAHAQIGKVALQDDAIPQLLNLQLQDEPEVLTEWSERRDHYCVDAQPLEAAYHKHFKNKYAQADVTFRISSDMEQTSQLQQQRFLNELGHRQLMLRVRSFCTGKELLLCTSKLDGTLLGYVCNTGTIERLAYEEYEGFITLQVPQGVLVIDLDHTIVHTPHGPAEQQALSAHLDNGRVFDVSAKQPAQQKMVCAPRTYLVNFFCDIFQKYHVMYCTAGSPQYGTDVVSSLQQYMLKTPDLDKRQRMWITKCTDPRRLVSSRECMGSNWSPNTQFKSLGMLLKMAYVPWYAEQIVIILDDNPGVWKRPSERNLATMIPVPRQNLVTSDSSAQPWLLACSEIVKRLHEQMFVTGRPTKPLPDVFRDVSAALKQAELRRAGH